MSDRRNRRRDAKKLVAAAEAVAHEIEQLAPSAPDDQTDLPSQQTPTGVPYSAEHFQADVEAAEATTLARWETKPGAPAVAPFTLTTFDARPINAQDFAKFPTAAEIAANAGQTIATFSYDVPAGRYCLPRKLSFVAYCNETGVPDVRDNATGAPNVNIYMTVFVDDLAVDQLNHLRVDQCCAVSPLAPAIEMDVYFLAQPGQSVTVQFEILNADFTFQYIAFQMTGNLLLRRGDEPQAEPATGTPLSVRRG